MGRTYYFESFPMTCSSALEVVHSCDGIVKVASDCGWPKEAKTTSSAWLTASCALCPAFILIPTVKLIKSAIKVHTDLHNPVETRCNEMN
ncbi:uncharacterized protein CCR75_005756 [Bremia lactucae]|uniref:Uncharacterized protein n=1 Tax=Bremia lactucae TaxID=4779 RepID=A0A976FFM9_BRELC|nr:hypothetical protein CCR75_005756 [Bremia lactucae]